MILVPDLELSYSVIPRVLYIPSTNAVLHHRVQRPGRLVNMDLTPVDKFVDINDHNAYVRMYLADLDISSLLVKKFESPALYLGMLHSHFGHFLVESMTRLWPATLHGEKFDYFVATDNHWNIGHTFKRVGPFANMILSTIGARVDDVWCIDYPCIIENLCVATPSTTAMSAPAHYYTNKYRDSMQEIGRSLSSVKPNSIDRPLFLSRELVYDQTGLSIELAKAAAKFADVVKLETYSISDQIAIESERKNILGQIGSALHVLLLCEGNKNVSVLVDREVTPMATTYFKELDTLYSNKVT